MTKHTAIIIKRSPIFIGRNLIFIQLLGYIAFLGTGALADYGILYGTLSIAKIFSYEFVYATFIVLAELMLIILTFLQWFYTYYRVTSEAIHSASGIIVRRKTALPLERVSGVSHEFTLLGKIFGYGTLILHGTSGESVRLRYVATPDRYARYIMKLMKGGGNAGVPRLAFTREEDVRTLLAREEGEQLEFKRSMRWDVRLGRVNKQLEKMVMKSIAAFLNSAGGYLVVGVDDGRAVVGLDEDYKSLTRSDADGFENHFTHVFNSVIGPEFRHFVKLYFSTIDGKEICVIEVAPSTRPVYVRFEKDEEFYVRTGNSTTPLRLSEAASYLEQWRRERG